jgi:putative pyruvate formate lyase activating enzyme
MPGVSDYGEVASRAIAEMHRQVGDLRIVDGVAVSGILVRHLVMPGDAADTARIMEYLAKLSRETYVNIMPQYRPSYKAGSDRVIGRRLRHDEFDNAVHAARDAGLRRVET